MNRNELLVLQPTPFCNLDCSYCYLPGRDHRGRMTLETVRKAAQFVKSLGAADEHFRVLWHMGEPLTVPPSWYREAHHVVSEVLGPRKVEFHFQTNAVLLSPAWMELLREDARIQIGISLDGPSELHDARRRTRNGGPTHAAVMEAVSLLRTSGVPFNVIAVITDLTLDRADDFYDFFLAIAPKLLALNPEEVDGIRTVSSLGAAHSERRYRSFLRRLAERVLRDRSPLVIRELVQVEQFIRTNRRSESIECAGNRVNSSGQIVSVDWRGNLHTFSPELLGMAIPGVGQWLGNVHTDSPITIESSLPHATLRGTIDRGIARCRAQCQYFQFCGGGSPSNKWFENGSFDSDETRYCRLAIQAPIDEYLRASAECDSPAEVH